MERSNVLLGLENEEKELCEPMFTCEADTALPRLLKTGRVNLFILLSASENCERVKGEEEKKGRREEGMEAKEEMREEGREGRGRNDETYSWEYYFCLILVP